MNGTSWPLPGGVRVEVDGNPLGSCAANPECAVTNATALLTLRDPPPGALFVLRAHAIVEQPATLVAPVLGLRTPDVLSADVVAEGHARVPG
ncbi:MAG: hypothetical protein LC624_08370 [Halobacteriales archaeon]|nr:hypothetical protein [Halobacteriales archaeon]